MFYIGAIMSKTVSENFFFPLVTKRKIMHSKSVVNIRCVRRLVD